MPAVVVVLPGQTGPFSGELPASLVRPDRNNFAPRLGFAWKPFSKTVVRGGYGINYNTGAYQASHNSWRFSRHFRLRKPMCKPTLGADAADGFPACPAGEIENNYAVNPNYRLGYVQIRNLDVQQQIRPTLF